MSKTFTQIREYYKQKNIKVSGSLKKIQINLWDICKDSIYNIDGSTTSLEEMDTLIEQAIKQAKKRQEISQILIDKKKVENFNLKIKRKKERQDRYKKAKSIKWSYLKKFKKSRDMRYLQNRIDYLLLKKAKWYHPDDFLRIYDSGGIANNNKKVVELTNSMQTKKWFGSCLIASNIKESGKKILLNGSHRYMAVVKNKKDDDLAIPVVTMKQVCEIYKTEFTYLKKENSLLEKYISCEFLANHPLNLQFWFDKIWGTELQAQLGFDF